MGWMSWSSKRMHWTRMRAQEDGPNENVAVVATAVKCGKCIYYYLLQPRVMSYTGLVKLTFMTGECFFFC